MRAKLIALAMLGSASTFAGTALALNPQPLPPGLRHAPVFNQAGPTALPYRPGARIHVPHCYAVQVGDPRKQPPMRVCK